MTRVPTIWEREPDDITTVYLGQFTREHGNAIAEQLEDRGIAWWYKEPGIISSVWEYGIRMFVDEAHLDEAREIAERVGAAAGLPKKRR
jgi:hypothetical protein